MRSLKYVIVIILFGFKTSLNAQLLPSIGLNAQPPNTATLCYPPYYTGSFYTSGYQVGNTVNDFKLYNLLGDSIILSDELQNGKPILLIAGSLTCPVFRGKIPTINQVMATYGSSISVFVIYTIEAHPTNISVYSGNVNVTNQNINDNILFPNSLTYGDRKQMVDTMSDYVSLNAPVFIDGPCNEWWNNFGPAPNNSYLIDINGVVVSKHGWFHKQPTDNIFCDLDNYLSITSGSCIVTTAPGHFSVNVINNISNGIPGSTLYDKALIVNTQSVPVTVTAQKVFEVLPSGWQASFCADVCYTANDYNISFVVAAYDTLDFSLDFSTSMVGDSGKVGVQFSNLNNSNNSFNYWFKASTYPSTGVKENNGGSDIIFYPNPFSGSIKISSSENDFEIEINDVVGRQMTYLIGTREIDTHTWPSGVYIVHYRSDKYDIMRKVILGR
ncbi:MAG: T9SS type A sorting domain-containing protein [Bacteroidota bacterium]|nr:T9SS type A sorting domain-containing protein [Bacteroidota bacterium]